MKMFPVFQDEKGTRGKLTLQASPPTKHALGLFSDEKNFHQDQMVNSQNNLWFALLTQSVPISMKIKHPVCIMVFEIVTSDNDIMAPFNFSRGRRLNIKVYVKCLKEVVQPWIKKVAARRPYI